MRSFGVKDGFLAPTIRGIAEDRQGNMWICGLTVLYVLAGNQIQAVTKPTDEYLPWNAAPGARNEMWVGSYGTGLSRHSWPGKTGVGPSWNVKLPDPNFNFLMADSKGAIWFGNSAGLFRFVEGEPEAMPLPLKRVDIRVGAEGKNGSMYAGRECRSKLPKS